MRKDNTFREKKNQKPTKTTQKKFLACPFWVLKVVCANKALQYVCSTVPEECELHFKNQICLNLMREKVKFFPQVHHGVPLSALQNRSAAFMYHCGGRYKLADVQKGVQRQHKFLVIVKARLIEAETNESNKADKI